MADSVLAVTSLLLCFLLILVLPTGLILRLTRRLRKSHPILRWVIAFQPSLVIIAVVFLSILWYPQKRAYKAAPGIRLEDRAGTGIHKEPGAAFDKAPPNFPWPPPTPSARFVVPWKVFARDKTLGQVTIQLNEALETTGYLEKSYYRVPEGIAVVTRLEHIYPDGRPFEEAQRWLVDDSYVRSLSLSEYLRRLFAVDQGFYRVVVFTITPEAFAATNHPVTSTEASSWLSNGFNDLPENISDEQLRPGEACTALIYEFEKDHGQPPHLSLPSRIGAVQHLKASGLYVLLTNQPQRSGQ